MSQKEGQSNNMLAMFTKLVETLKSQRMSDQDINAIASSIEKLNHSLFGVSKLKNQTAYNPQERGAYDRFLSELEELIHIWNLCIEKREVRRGIDRRFWYIYESFKYLNKQDILLRVMDAFEKISDEQKVNYSKMKDAYPFLNNYIDISRNDYSLIEEYIDMMISNVEKYKWFYEHLDDYRSKYILMGIVEYWFDFDLEKLLRLTETVFCDYFDLDIIRCDEKEVFVDVGAYIGDTIADYINTYGVFNKIFAYEFTPSTFECLKNNFESINNVVLRQKGVGGEKREVYITDILSAGNSMKNKGNVCVEIVTLDEDIREKVTLVKMDIEGAEMEAIEGARNHIINEKPKLMISTYHRPADIFEIPYLINEIRDDYKFYLRIDGAEMWPCDYVLYAI